MIKADIDERSIGDRTNDANVHNLVLLLAHAKADAILAKIPDNKIGLLLLTGKIHSKTI